MKLRNNRLLSRMSCEGTCTVPAPVEAPVAGFERHADHDVVNNEERGERMMPAAPQAASGADEARISSYQVDHGRFQSVSVISYLADHSAFTSRHAPRVLIVIPIRTPE